MRGIARIAAIGTVAVLAALTGSGVAAADPDVGVVGPSLWEASIGLDDGGNVPGVQCVQAALGLPVDGGYGSQTFDAVQDFQSRYGLSVDGVVGPLTGDIIIARTSNLSPWCIEYLPTTYDHRAFVSSPKPVPVDHDGRSAWSDLVDSGESTVFCTMDAIEGQIESPFRMFKIIKNWELPTVEDLTRAPNPILFGGRVIGCTVFDAKPAY